MSNNTACVSIRTTVGSIGTQNNKPTGNIIYQEWYKTITTKSGRPDLTAITLLSEIVYWYKPKTARNLDASVINLNHKFRGDSWQTSYSYLSAKFSYNHQRIRRGLVRLEELGIIQRQFKDTVLYGQKYNNVLFIKLDPKYLAKFLDKYSSAKNINNDFIVHQFVAPSLQIDTDIYKDKENNKNIETRSSESSFVEENKLGTLEENSVDEITNDEQMDVSKSKSEYFKKKLYLASFLPITKEEASSICGKIGRDFAISYINKLFGKLSNDQRYQDRSFYSRAIFLKYVEKILKHEMRDADLASREDFQFKQDKETIAQETYLANIENSRDTSQYAVFRRKIIASFENSIAYNFLKNLKSINFDTLARSTDHEKRESSLMRLEFYRKIELNETMQEAIKVAAKISYGLNVDKIAISSYTEKKKILEIVGQSDDHSVAIKEDTSLWGKIRTRLLDYYDPMIDKAWFSRLSGEEELSGNHHKLTLKAPNSFVQSWIKNNYFRDIKHIAESLKLNLTDQILLI